MNPIIEMIYYKSPIFIQNLAISFMGLKLRSERYSPAGKQMLDELKRNAEYDCELMIRYQDREFRKLARHAIETTGFYRNWADQNKFCAEDIKGIGDIREFPIIDKMILKDAPEMFVSNDQKLKTTQFSLYTSGTTGSPLKVVTDKASRSKHYAFFTRLRSQFGLDEKSKRATLFGRIIMRGDAKKPPFWRYDAANKNLLMSSYHLNELNLIFYYQKLLEYQPDEIFAYPSSIYRVAEFILKEKLKPIDAKLVMTTAENLLPYQKTAISSAFNAPLLNQYGCTEMAFFCSGLKDQPMKFHPEHGLAEIRTSAGLVSDAGEGELITTGFINYSMPVIRYQTGDNVNLGPRDEFGWQTLHDVNGRTDDTVYSKDGTPIGRLDPIFKGSKGIKYSQIFQKEIGDIEIRIVPDINYDQTLGDELIRELRKRVGSELKVEIKLMDKIEKERNGKFRPVISAYKP